MLKNNDFEVPRSMLRLCVIVLMALVLSGCGGLTKSDSAAISTWWLEPLPESGSAVNNSPERSDNAIVLVSVTVVPGLDTANILNLSPNAELNYYTGARWADDLPELLNSLVGRTLEAQGGYQVVSRRNSLDLDRCILKLEVKAFYAELSQAGNTEDVHISFSGEYSCEGDPSRFFKVDSRTPVKANRMGSIVASFQTGLNASLAQLLTQIQ